MRCLLTRILISHALDRNRSPGRSVQRHVEHCDHCERFYSESLSLAEGLRSAASVESESWDRHLTVRIMNRIDRQDCSNRPRSARWMRTPWVLVAATCLVIAITSGMILFTQNGDDEPTRDEVAASLEAVAELGQKLLGRHLAGESDAEFLGFVSKPLSFVSKPLTAEVDRLAEDAEAMRGFVVAILPINLLHTQSMK